MNSQALGNLVFRTIRDTLREVPADTRVEVWQALMEGYCRHCGAEMPDGTHCHCEDDE
jgi:hypothetical protein